jgi:hypothetical protein
MGWFSDKVEQARWDKDIVALRVSGALGRNADDREEDRRIADRMSDCPRNPRNGGDGYRRR